MRFSSATNRVKSKSNCVGDSFCWRLHVDFYGDDDVLEVFDTHPLGVRGGLARHKAFTVHLMLPCGNPKLIV